MLFRLCSPTFLRDGGDVTVDMLQEKYSPFKRMQAIGTVNSVMKMLTCTRRQLDAPRVFLGDAHACLILFGNLCQWPHSGTTETKSCCQVCSSSIITEGSRTDPEQILSLWIDRHRHASDFRA